MQLVFGQDAIINTKFIADWEFIHQRKQRIIHQNNIRENSKRKPHKYNIGDQVLQKAAENTKYGGPAYIGPYTITLVNDNGTVCLNKGVYTETVNIRNVKPYHQSALVP